MDSNLLTITSNMLSRMSYHVCLHALLAAFWNAIIVAADGFYKAVPLGRYTQRDADLAT